MSVESSGESYYIEGRILPLLQFTSCQARVTCWAVCQVAFERTYRIANTSFYLGTQADVRLAHTLYLSIPGGVRGSDSSQRNLVEKHWGRNAFQLQKQMVMSLTPSLVAQMIISLQSRSPGFDPQAGKIPWRREWQSAPAFLPGELHGRGAWWATVHGVTKSQTQLSS